MEDRRVVASDGVASVGGGDVAGWLGERVLRGQELLSKAGIYFAHCCLSAARLASTHVLLQTHFLNLFFI